MFNILATVVWLIEESNAIAASMRIKLDEEEAALRTVTCAKANVRAAKKAAKHAADNDDAPGDAMTNIITTTYDDAQARLAAAEVAYALKGEEYTFLFNDCVMKGEELHAAAKAAGFLNVQSAYDYYYHGQHHHAKRISSAAFEPLAVEEKPTKRFCP